MADTIRSLSELNSLFADNTNGAITPQDIRDLVVSMMVHGEIGSGAKASVTLGTGFQTLDFDVAGQVGRGLTVDTINKWITDVPVEMKAEVVLEVIFKGVPTTDYEFAVFKNPDTTPIKLNRVNAIVHSLDLAQTSSIKMGATIQLAVGDKLQAGVKASGAAFELLRGRLYVQRVGVE